MPNTDEIRNIFALAEKEARERASRLLDLAKPTQELGEKLPDQFLRSAFASLARAYIEIAAEVTSSVVLIRSVSILFELFDRSLSPEARLRLAEAAQDVSGIAETWVRGPDPSSWRRPT